MKPADCVKLENDRAFKLDYARKTPYWKSILFIAPACFLFLGLFGMLYLLGYDMLVTWYTIPFAAFFVIGTIWLKAIKRHILKTMVDNPENFHVSIVKPFGEKDGYVYCVYVNSEKRHNEYYISSIAESYSIDSLTNTELTQAKKKPVATYDETVEAEIFIRAFFHRDISKRNAAWRDDNSFPLLIIDKKQIEIIKGKDLT